MGVGDEIPEERNVNALVAARVGGAGRLAGGMKPKEPGGKPSGDKLSEDKPKPGGPDREGGGGSLSGASSALDQEMKASNQPLNQETDASKEPITRTSPSPG